MTEKQEADYNEYDNNMKICRGGIFKMCSQNLKQTMRKAFAAVMSAAFVFTAVWSGTGTTTVYAEETKGQLNVTYHTQAEISARIKSDAISMNDSLNYAVDPQLAPPYDNAGVLDQDTLNSALKTMNQIRYIAGLQDNVTLNDGYIKQAQAAALVNYANRSLSHYPEKPAGMNDEMYSVGKQGASSCNIAYASWKRSLNATIVQSWMEDGDSSNIDRVGHRRWILNPSMGQTGFGAVYGPGGTYSALYCFNRGNQSAWETQVAWPAQNMPVGYFDTGFPWSISMGRSVDKNSVHVTLTRVNDNATWSFSAGGSNGYFNVNNGGYGQSGCIIFRPDGVGQYQAGDTFKVSITGGGVNLSYTVNFFDPDNVEQDEFVTSVDWAAVDALLDTVPDGGAAAVLTGCRFEVPAETLNKIAGRNMLCAFHVDSDLIFSISGANMQAAAVPWNVNVSYKSGIPSSRLAQIKEGAAATRTFCIADTGEFPAPMNVHISWKAEHAGKQAVLYCYDDASGALYEMGRCGIVEGGQSVFTIDRGRNYIAVVEK